MPRIEGFIITDSSKARFRTWGHFGPDWTPNALDATWYVRRKDAESVCLTDEDAWCIITIDEAMGANNGQ